MGRHIMKWIAAAYAVSGAVLAGGCGSTPTTPDPTPTPPVTALSLTCPANVSAETASSTTTVTYASATPSGGTAPYTVSCTPASGTAFPLGTTSVACTASDAVQRAAACQFSVNVAAIPRLQGTNFVAFGDSITAGEVGDPRPARVDATLAWPARLGALLTARYKAQTVVVAAFGVSGEVLSPDGVERLAYVLDDVHPDVLLFLEGINDIDERGQEAVDEMGPALQSVLSRSQSAGVKKVFLSNLLPKLPCTPGTTECNDSNREFIVAANEQIRTVAANSNGYAILVDSYNALLANPTLYIGVDGLHPTADGHQKIADTFFDAIKANFELPTPTTAGTFSIRR